MNVTNPLSETLYFRIKGEATLEFKPGETVLTAAVFKKYSDALHRAEKAGKLKLTSPPKPVAKKRRTRTPKTSPTKG